MFHEEDLEIMIGSQLSFHIHTAQVVAKAFEVLGMIEQSLESFNKQMNTLLFTSIVRHILEYRNCVWGPTHCEDEDAVGQVLKCVTKLNRLTDILLKTT